MAPPGALVMVPAARGAMPARRHLGVIFAATTAIVAVSLAAVLIVVERRGGTASRPSHAAAAVSADPTLTPAQLASAWGSSTLYVQTDIAGQTQASGSAWVYDAGQGLIVTNAHVVNTGTDFTAGQGAQRQPAEVVGVSVCNDLAVLKVSDTAGLRTFRLGRQASVAQGQSVTVLGYPGNAAETPQLSETTGVVSVAHTAFTDEEGPEVPRMTDMVQISAPINPGNSGGPLLDAHGRLIGVVAASGSGTQDEGYAIGVDRVRSVVSQLARGDSFGYAGMKLVYPTQASDFTDLGLPVVDGGIIVQAADPNSPAYDAISSQIGDRPFVIEDINGQPLDGTLDSYCNAVGGLQAGQTAVFTVVLADGYRANVRLPFE
jgi:S1-C subfamily serine protease